MLWEVLIGGGEVLSETRQGGRQLLSEQIIAGITLGAVDEDR